MAGEGVDEFRHLEGCAMRKTVAHCPGEKRVLKVPKLRMFQFDDFDCAIRGQVLGSPKQDWIFRGAEYVHPVLGIIARVHV
jgi:hypothetical protein